MNEQSCGATPQNNPSGSVLHHVPTGALLEALPVGVYVCAEDGTIVHHNRRAGEIWGRSPVLGSPSERFCGSHRLFLQDGRHLPREDCPMAEALREKKAFRNLTMVIEQPDGRRVAALVNIDPIFDEDGNFCGAVNCFQDISEVQRMHAHAKQKERELEATLGALPAAVYCTDAEGRVTSYNEAAVVLAGRRPEIGSDQWCISWRLYTMDGAIMPHESCPMAVALREKRAISGGELLVEQPDGTRVPCMAFPTPLFDEHGELTGAVNMLIDISDRKHAENRQRLLINELNHRVKNTLAMVQAIATQTLRRSRSPSEFVASLTGRIQAFSRAHNILVQGTTGVDLTELVSDQVLLDSARTGRIVCSGAPVFLEPSAALHMAMVLYELGTNARKHGALSVPGGRVRIDWSTHFNGSRVLHLNWREEGGPPVSRPQSAGFGTALIERSLHTHGAEASITYADEGLECTIRMPLPEVHQTTEDWELRDADGRQSAGADRSPNWVLQGRRILVIEDEPLVALDMEGILREAGCVVAGTAGTVEDALRTIGECELDAALVDANLHGKPADEIAAALTRAGVRFAFVTGYGIESLPQSFRQARIITKPYQADDVISCLEDLLQRPEATPLKLAAAD